MDDDEFPGSLQHTIGAIFSRHNRAHYGGGDNTEMPAYKVWIEAVETAFLAQMTDNEVEMLYKEQSKGAVGSLVTRGVATREQIIAIAVLCFPE